jgi:hypothetical protein
MNTKLIGSALACIADLCRGVHIAPLAIVGASWCGLGPDAVSHPISSLHLGTAIIVFLETLHSFIARH